MWAWRSSAARIYATVQMAVELCKRPRYLQRQCSREGPDKRCQAGWPSLRIDECQPRCSKGVGRRRQAKWCVPKPCDVFIALSRRHGLAVRSCYWPCHTRDASRCHGFTLCGTCGCIRLHIVRPEASLYAAHSSPACQIQASNPVLCAREKTQSSEAVGRSHVRQQIELSHCIGRVHNCTLALVTRTFVEAITARCQKSDGVRCGCIT